MDKKEVKKFLVEWTVNFIKNRDVVLGSIIKIEESKDGFDLKVIYNDKEAFFIAEPFIKDIDNIISRVDKDIHVNIVLFNCLDNFNIIVDNWKRLVDFDKLTIYFVNMFSNSEKKWIIRPYVHNRISDEKSLKTGLKSMFSMVEPITEEDVLNKG